MPVIDDDESITDPGAPGTPDPGDEPTKKTPKAKKSEDDKAKEKAGGK